MVGVRAEGGASQSAVVRPLPRRPPILATQPAAADIRSPRLSLPAPSVLRVARRFFVWLSAAIVYASHRLYDRVKGDRTLEKKGARLRDLFERVGGTGIKIGQQLSIRVDFLPWEICRELGKLTDSVPPIAFAQCVGQIERASGTSIALAYAEIDETPIGSASVSCVFRGRLHSGEEVAIKVRRPGVENRFVEDLAIIGALVKLAESVTFVRPGLLLRFATDLREMFLEELDFSREANYQAMYRRYVKRDRMRWLSAPRVYQELSSHDVLVSEFVRGFPFAELLRAVETKDADVLARYAAEGIVPETLAQRLLETCFWSLFECPFFHGDPHPGNIVLQPNNHIVMLDFGACGISTAKQRDMGIESQRRLNEHDVGGAAAVSIAVLEPLPAVDVDELKQAAKRALTERLIILNTPSAQWWERTTAAMWLATLEATREFEVPANIDVLKLTRATLLYDTLVARLHPRFKMKKEFDRWQRSAIKRERRRAMRSAVRSGRTNSARRIQDAAEFRSLARRGVYWVSQMTSKLPRQYRERAATGSFIASAVVRLSLVASLLFTAGIGVVLLNAGFPSTFDHFALLAKRAISSPLVLATLALSGLFALRSIQVRLRDLDQRN